MTAILSRRSMSSFAIDLSLIPKIDPKKRARSCHGNSTERYREGKATASGISVRSGARTTSGVGQNASGRLSTPTTTGGNKNGLISQGVEFRYQG
ncbi:MAG TPA: hypothetical protein DHW45_13040 [Candidatus Latescibacteria bacterium]|nr:hypothetical protein [Candidatus Latescibacterota bacterium]